MDAGFKLSSVLILGLALGCGGSTYSNTADAGSGGTAADQACTAYAAAQCAKRVQCSQNNYLITRTYGDMATCQSRLHDSCINSLAAPGTGNTPTTIAACTAAYPNIACTDYLNNTITTGPCATQTGTLATGAACRFNAQCQTAFCSVPTGVECGTCAATPAVGAPCNGPSGVTTCGHGLDCVGADATTTPPTAGTCEAYVTMVGAACNSTTLPCGTGLSCTPNSATATNRTCQMAGTSGTACNGTSNNPGCDNDQGFTCNGTTHLCAAITVASAGTACGTNTDGTFTNCLGNGFCTGSTAASNHGTCSASASDSAACNRAVGPNCGSASTCVTGSGATAAGTCQFTDSSTCH